MTKVGRRTSNDLEICRWKEFAISADGQFALFNVPAAPLRKANLW